ncbi:MAG: VCBS repeat-containing protein [Verrucomicrobiota bacterium]|nr:VCBS repeat-containing protein [Verrucomicrobiota bacterium]
MKAFPILFFTLMQWALNAAEVPKFKRIQLTDKFYAEGASAGNFNNDKHSDVVSGPYWYAGPDFKKRYEIYDTKDFKPKGYSPNFNTWAYDVNGDGWDDVIRVSHPGQKVFWHENPRGNGEWKAHVAMDSLENESPQFIDVTGNGLPNMVGSVSGQFVYFSFDRKEPTKKWTRHNVSPPKSTGGKYTHGLGVGDVNCDGKMDIIDKDHWWMQPQSLEGDPLWKEFRFQFTGPGGADMFAYDFDGDGDNDIYTAAAAHSYGLTWFEQADSESGKKIWKRHLITGAKAEDNEFGVMFSQAHSAQLVDMDGDGIKDLITGKRWWAHNGNDPGGNDPAVLYWFKIVPGGKSGEAKFIPYQIDNDSGVGTQFLVKDITGDNKPDIIVSNKKGTFLHIQEGMTEQSPGPSK